MLPKSYKAPVTTHVICKSSFKMGQHLKQIVVQTSPNIIEQSSISLKVIAGSLSQIKIIVESIGIIKNQFKPIKIIKK